MGVFDQLVISNSAGEVIAVIQRGGPLEDGQFDPPGSGTWVPSGVTRVITDDFGVAPDGTPYFDTVAVDEGDQAALFVDPSNGAVAGSVWLER